MPREILTILKFEFLLPGLFSRTSGHSAFCLCVAQDRRTELLVSEDGSLVPWHAVRQGLAKSVVDYTLGRGYFRGLPCV